MFFEHRHSVQLIWLNIYSLWDPGPSFQWHKIYHIHHQYLEGQLISNLESSPWTITEKLWTSMHIAYSESCVNVSDANARMGQLLKNSLISREMSGITVASFSLFYLNLCAITTYTREGHCSMILGNVDNATTMFPFFNNWQNCDISRNRWCG